METFILLHKKNTKEHVFFLTGAELEYLIRGAAEDTGRVANENNGVEGHHK